MLRNLSAAFLRKLLFFPFPGTIHNLLVRDQVLIRFAFSEGLFKFLFLLIRHVIPEIPVFFFVLIIEKQLVKLVQDSLILNLIDKLVKVVSYLSNVHACGI